MSKSYKVTLNGILIGTSDLEKADAPMGVVIGALKITNQKFGYDYLKKYCGNNQIELALDSPKDKIISTMNIHELKITNDSGIEIKGVGNQITGTDNEEYEVSIFGIPYPFYEEEFPHHVREYENMFKKE